jgi:phosphatidylinositol alpha-mannosyltransferase
MKIALVSPYDFAYPGGVVNHISALGHELIKMGNDIRIIAPASKAISNLGGTFVHIGKPLPLPTSGSIARVNISPILRPSVKDILDEEHFDVIHLHEPLVPTLCTSVLKLSRTVNVGTFHAYDSSPGYSFLQPLSSALLGRLVARLDGRIAVSKPAMDFVSRHFPGKYQIIPNGVDTRHFSTEALPIEELCDGKLNILFVGRLEKRKGADYMIKAFLHVKHEIPRSRLIIVGPGSILRSKYRRLVKQCGLEQDIFFAGYVPYDELPRYYATADVFCSPATGRESFGIVLLEAMAVGKPVVASHIEGYASVVRNNIEGLLVPPRSEDHLAHALISLLTDASLRRAMGSNGMSRAAKYDWTYVAQQVQDYYLSVRKESTQRDSGSFRRELKGIMKDLCLKGLGSLS